MSSRTLSLKQLREFDDLCDVFEQDWKAGKTPRVSDYLGTTAEPARSYLLCMLLETEFDLLDGLRQPIPYSRYSEQFPHLRGWLEKKRSMSASPGVGPIDPPPSPSSKQRELGKYAIIDKLGEGGMGTVYRARHTMVEYQRAVKVLHSSLAGHPAAMKRFLIEAQACVELEHDNIVKTYHVDQEADGTVYIVMELLDGVDLQKLVELEGRRKTEEALSLIEQAAEGLEFAHQQGVVHRDIKPQNIMQTSQGRIKILDLGLARILDRDVDEPILDGPAPLDATRATVTHFQSRLTNENALLGTVAYMSPEQAQDPRQADRQSDIYSLGCTLYYLLTGHHAFSGRDPAVILERHLAGDYAPLRHYRPDVPEEVSQLVSRMMARQRADRFPSAAALIRELRVQRLGEEKEEQAPPPFVPLKLGQVKQVGQRLVELEIVSADEWSTAEQQAQPSDRSDPIDATSVLAKLQELKSARPGQDSALSHFQVNHLLSGNVDLLRLPEHILLEQLGAGWKGAIYKVRNSRLNRIEAMRIFSPGALEGVAGTGLERLGEAWQDCFERLAKLQIPSCPGYLLSGRYTSRLHGEMAFLTSEYVAGRTLTQVVAEQRLPDGREIDMDWCFATMVALSRALEGVHEIGLLHQDIQPNAIMILSDGSPQLLDVGIAALMRPSPNQAATTLAGAWNERTNKLRKRLRSSDRTVSRSMEPTMMETPTVGTPHIIPPEQWQDQTTASIATDIYNLGCTLFYLFSGGDFPFCGNNSLELMQQHLQQDPLRSNAGKKIPQPLRGIVRTALAKQIRDRYQSAEEMTRDIEASWKNSS